MVAKKKPKGENSQSEDTSDAALRRRAEEEMNTNPNDAAENLGKQSPHKVMKILEELRVHQIELEMQNDELRKSQEELDSARMKYFDLYDLAPIGYLTVSDKGLIVEANLTFATMMGVARSALPKKPFTKFIFHEDQDIFYMHRKPLFEKGEPQVCEMRLLRDGGKLFWARLDATLVEDTEGNPICRVVVSDITERKKAEAASRNYLKIAGTMFIALDTAGTVTLANDKACEILGLPVDKIVGKNWFDSFIPERMRAEVKDVFEKILAGNLEPVSSFENPVITHDGRERIIQWENTYHHDDVGNISGTLASGMDITEQQKAKDALILKDIVFKSSIAANSIADIHGVITDANPMFLALWGYSRPDEVVGRPISEFFADKEELIKVLESLNKTGEWKGEFVAKKKDGSAFISQGFATKIMDADGNLIGYQSANIDITEQKTAERKIRDLAKFPEENPNPVMRVSSEGILIYSNKAGEAIQGDCGCVPGKEVPPFWKGIIFDCHAKKDVITMEAAQGGRVFQVTLTPVADGGYVNMYWSDITDRKKTEESLAQNRELLRDTAEMAKIGGWEYFTDTLHQTWTEETFRILEVDIGKGAPKVPEGANFIAPEYRPMADRAIQRAMEFGEPYDQEWEVITAKGNRKWVRAVAKVNRTEGKITSISGSFQDITERKKAEASLTASEVRYRRLFEAAKDGILILDAKTGQIMDVNPFLTDLLGFTREEFLGKKIWDLGFFKDIAANEANFLELQNKGYVRYADMPLETRDGRKINVEFVSNVYLIDKTKVVQCNIRDISDRKAAERLKQLHELRTATYLALHEMASATEQELFDYCLEASMKITGSGLSFLGWMNRDATEMTIHSWSRTAMAQCNMVDKQFIFPIANSGLWGECVRQRKPIIVNDYSKKHKGKKGLPEGHMPLKNLLSVPISDRGHIVAVAAVANKDSDYTDDDAAALHVLINKMWEIHRRRHHEAEIDNLNSFLLSIRNLNQEIVKETDFDKLLATSCKILTEIRGYIDVSIAFADAETGEMQSRAHYGEHEKVPWRYSPECDGEVPPCIRRVMGDNSSVILDKEHGICADCGFCDHEEAHQSILVPMRNKAGNLMGIISACLEMGRAIHPQEVPLFEEVAGDLVFAHEKISGELSLRESEENLRIAQHLAKLGSWSWNLKTGELYLSDEMYNIIGLEKNGDAQDVSKHEPYYTPESWVLFQSTVEDAMRTGEPYGLELEIVRKDGPNRRTVTRGEPIKDETGTVIGLRGTLQDITERKEAEEAICKQLDELKRWQNVMLDREDRVQELKCEINKLCHQAGEKSRYAEQED